MQPQIAISEKNYAKCFARICNFFLKYKNPKTSSKNNIREKQVSFKQNFIKNNQNIFSNVSETILLFMIFNKREL